MPTLDHVRGWADRLRRMASSRSLLAASLLAALAGAALTRLPLFEVPGYELGAAMTLLLAPLGLWAGVRAAWLEPADGGRTSRVLGAWGAAALWSLLVLLLPFLAAVMGAWLGSPCSPWTGVGFYGLLPVPTALLAPAIGLGIGWTTRRRLVASLSALAVMLLGLGSALWPLWSGPQVFALDHLLGYFPGPLYDEALRVDARLLIHRALTLAWVAWLLIALASLRDPASGTLRLDRLGRGRLALLLALLVPMVVARRFAPELGQEASAASLDRVLGGRLETPHFVLHYPREKKLEDVRRLERDLEFDYSQVTGFLGAAPSGKVHAWLYRSPEEKRRLVGASYTNFAKPWRLEFHVQDAPFPHPIARHELAHAVAAEFGSRPFKVSARNLLSVNIGLVEGLAVAADAKDDELTLHQWAAAMRRLKLAPDVRRIVAPAGFYGEAPARAYTLAGSFLRFLAERHGNARLRALYPAGDFQAAFGRSLDALARDWETFLDSVPLGERALHTAQVRFQRPSLFQRPCAREVAGMSEEAAALRQRDPLTALAMFRRCGELEPQNAGFARAQAELLVDREEYAAARNLWEQLLEQDLTDGTRALALIELGDIAWAQGDRTKARECFARALHLRRDRQTDRAALIRGWAVDAPQVGEQVRRLFARSGELPEVMALREAVDLGEAGAQATLQYLIGRQLVLREAPSAALRYLRAARQLGLAPEVAIENLRLLATASYLAGDCQAAREPLDELSRKGDEADQSFAEQWRARCDFEARAYLGLLRSER